jgi:HEAT repeat protein
MMLEFRVLFSAVVTAVVSLLLVFLQWQFVFPLVALGYLGYKYVHYWRRVDPDRNLDADPPPGRLLEKMTVVFVVVFVATRLAVFPLFDPVWTQATLGVPQFDLSALRTFLDQLLPFVGAWVTVLAPLATVSYVVSQFSLRLGGGVTSRTAALRAALWQTVARVPLVLAWAAIFTLGPVYSLWRGPLAAVAGSTGGSVPLAVGVAPVVDAGGSVFFVVMALGHLLPLLVVGAYEAASRGKYDDLRVPELLGFRGLYPPDRTASAVNYALPAVAYLLYTVAAVVFVPVGPLRGALLLPPLVAMLLATDVRGVVSRVSRALPTSVRGADPVVAGLCAGLGFLALFVLTRVGGVGLGVDPAAAVFFPVFATPLALGTNAVTAAVKTRRARSFRDSVDENPGAVDESTVDRLLVYADARSDRLRASAVDALASAVWASPYRETESLAVFETALGHDDPRFSRPGLRGVVRLFRADRGLDSVGGLLEPDLFGTVADALDSDDARTRALAAEAFCRVVATGHSAGRTDELLATLRAVPLDAVEDAVTGDEATQHLTDGAVEAFALLWWARDSPVGASLTRADRQRVLTDLVWWSAFASDVPRGKAAFAVASTPAPVDEQGVDAVRQQLGNDVALTRFVAAHVVRSSMDDHADQFAAGELVGLLEDDYEPVRWVGADALRAYVQVTGDSEGVLGSLLSHLDAADPESAGAAEATVLATLELIDEDVVAGREGVAETVASYVGSEDRDVAASAASVLASFVERRPAGGRDQAVRTSLEMGLTHAGDAVREHCARAAAAVVADDPSNGRPFVRGLLLNLGTAGEISEMAASALVQVLEQYPEYGTEFLPETVGGLRNPTTISRQYAGAMVVGRTVSGVTARILAEVTEYDTSGGDVLVGPLVDLAGNSESATREYVFAALANVSEDYPDAAREALPASQSALDAGDVRVRRNAAQVLSNVAIEYPDAVAPFASSLVVAVDDTDPQMRSLALVTLGTVGAAAPEAVEPDVRRLIGRLDDDSSLVREHAAKAMVTIATKHPEIVEPGAEASDRLRRAQRDPAVDIDEDLVQEAANAIRTGTPPGEAVTNESDEGSTDIFTPESADEAGQSGDTRVFEPPSDDEESVAAPPDPGEDFPAEAPSLDGDGPVDPPEPDDDSG